MLAEPVRRLHAPDALAGLRLVRRVGVGGEGEVWEGVTAGGERRAVKIVRPEATASPEQVAIRSDWLRRIDHPALVRVIRAGRLGGAMAPDGLDGCGVVVMEYVDGADLSRAPATPLPRVRALLGPLAGALDDLHAGRWSDGVALVHRDVKPANLVATADERVVLVDCSSLCGLDRDLLTRIGTPVFAAPEVTTGRIGPPADVYSLAATVVALVSGVRGDALMELVARPAALDLPTAVVAALDPDPVRRPRRAAELLAVPRVAAVGSWLPAMRGATDAAAADDTGPPVVPDDVHRGVSADVPGDVRGDASGPPVGPAPVVDVPPALPVLTVPAPPRRPVWPVLVALAGVAGLAVGGVTDPPTRGLTWGAAAAALSVVVHAALGVPSWHALTIPVVSWASLLAGRLGCEPIARAWVRLTTMGSLSIAVALILVGIAQTGAAESGSLAVVVSTAAVVTCALIAVAARHHGPRTAWIRVAVLPLTLLGALLTLGAAVVALPSALLGRPDRLRWLLAEASRAVGGAVAAWAPEAAPAGTVRDPASTHR